MKKNSLQSYKVQYRLKAELKTTNQIPISPLRMSSLVVVHCTRDEETKSLKYRKLRQVTPTQYKLYQKYCIFSC